MVEHIVLVKLSDDVTDDQVDELISRTLALKDVIPGLVDIQQGRNFAGRSQGYEIGMTARFEDRPALEAYLPHPSHQAILAYLEEIGLEDLIVVDFDTN